jgi:hypothetical protein
MTEIISFEQQWHVHSLCQCVCRTIGKIKSCFGIDALSIALKRRNSSAGLYLVERDNFEVIFDLEKAPQPRNSRRTVRIPVMADRLSISRRTVNPIDRGQHSGEGGQHLPSTAS